MLTLMTPAVALAVPTEVLAEHLHLNTAAPELDETTTLDRLIRAATAAIERHVCGALIMQTWRWRLDRWCERLPLSPVAAIEGVDLIDADGVAAPWTGWVLGHAAPQRLLTRQGTLRPPIPDGGYVEVTFTAGYGLGWTDVPDDLRQAVALLAAQYYEHRDATELSVAALPPGIASLVAPYRSVRI